MAAGTTLNDQQRDPFRRSVSPLGASRFERPYQTPPRPQTADRDASTALNSKSSGRSGGNHGIISTLSSNPPVGKVSVALKPRPNSAGTNKSSTEASRATKKSSTETSETTTGSSKATTGTSPATMQTSPTTIGSDDYTYLRWHAEKESIESPVCVVSPDEWFDHYNSDASLDTSSEISKQDILPDRATLYTVKDILLYDSEGNSRTFGSLTDPSTASHERQLIIFVRHFYCGACQAYLKALTQGISISDYFSIPVPTSIIIIGCGEPDLIPHYKQFTGCPFPMFADPSRQLFKKLGMNTTLKTGRERPEYMKDISKAAWLGGQVATIGRSLNDDGGIRLRDVFRGGNLMQIGGEFLFEGGECVFAHRMRHYRDHTEIKVLRQLLELEE